MRLSRAPPADVAGSQAAVKNRSSRFVALALATWLIGSACLSGDAQADGLVFLGNGDFGSVGLVGSSYYAEKVFIIINQSQITAVQLTAAIEDPEIPDVFLWNGPTPSTPGTYPGSSFPSMTPVYPACGTTLAPLESCEMYLRFTAPIDVPSTQFTGTLRVEYNDGTLRSIEQPLAATIAPEPSSLSLGFVALAAGLLNGLRSRRGSRHPSPSPGLRAGGPSQAPPVI